MISRLNEDKWSKCRDIRLESLKNEPSAFSSSYDMEKNLSETEWRKRIKNSLFAISEGRIIGMIAVIYKENFGELNGLYVKKEFRKSLLAQGNPGKTHVILFIKNKNTAGSLEDAPL